MGALAPVILGLVGYSPTGHLDHKSNDVVRHDHSAVVYGPVFRPLTVQHKNDGDDVSTFFGCNDSAYWDIAGDVPSSEDVFPFDYGVASWEESALDASISLPPNPKNVIVEQDSTIELTINEHDSLVGNDNEDLNADGSASSTFRRVVKASWTLVDQFSTLVISYGLGIPPLGVTTTALALPTGRQMAVSGARKGERSFPLTISNSPP